MMVRYDAIVIGGGLGGLTAGAKLAKEGKKVLLIEQHSVPGGLATTFKRKDYKMEVGLHFMDGLDSNDLKKKIFDDLNVFENVKFVKIPDFFRFKNDRVDIVVPDNTKDAIEVLKSYFPEEKKGIAKFFSRINGIEKELKQLGKEKSRLKRFPIFFPIFFPNVFFNTYRTLGSFLDSIIDDEDLKLILQGNISHYHDNPYTMSLIYFGLAQSSYYNNGGYFIKGGSQKLSNYLTKFIMGNGGKVLLNNIVEKIIIKDNCAVGVEYKKTNHDSGDREVVFADNIIANCAVPNVVNMLPSKKRGLLGEKLKDLSYSNSLLIIFIGFKKEVKKIGNKSYSTFVFSESIKSLGDVVKNHRGGYEKKNFVFVDYSQVDSGLASKGKSSGVICAIDYIENWNNLDQKEYKRKKDEVAQIFFRRLDKLIPGVVDIIDYYEVATPMTIERYTQNPCGSVYGYSQIPEQAGYLRVPNESPISNLYFASGWSHPGGCYTGVILSGWISAKKILKKNRYSFT